MSAHSFLATPASMGTLCLLVPWIFLKLWSDARPLGYWQEGFKPHLTLELDLLALGKALPPSFSLLLWAASLL